MPTTKLYEGQKLEDIHVHFSETELKLLDDLCQVARRDRSNLVRFLVWRAAAIASNGGTLPQTIDPKVVDLVSAEDLSAG